MARCRRTMRPSTAGKAGRQKARGAPRPRPLDGTARQMGRHLMRCDARSNGDRASSPVCGLRHCRMRCRTAIKTLLQSHGVSRAWGKAPSARCDVPHALAVCPWSTTMYVLCGRCAHWAKGTLPVGKHEVALMDDGGRSRGRPCSASRLGSKLRPDARRGSTREAL